MSNAGQPDWAQMAKRFDVFLPAIAPVGDALLQALDARPGQHILDVASGTGEPALTLARRMGARVEILGTDAAAPMVDVANAKARAEGLAHISFRPMPAEHLDLEDDRFDRVLSRFGVMLFADSQQGLNEMCRVMRPGGRVAVAVWGEHMPSLRWAYDAMKGRLPEDLHPPYHKIIAMGSVPTLETCMARAGFRDVDVTLRHFDYSFPSFDAYWDAVEFSGILQQQMDALPETERAVVQAEVRQMAVVFEREGGFHVPHDFLIGVATK
jgi:ubiquinone/menaquinone biosynthesis C-methylase UbiE